MNRIKGVWKKNREGILSVCVLLVCLFFLYVYSTLIYQRYILYASERTDRLASIKIDSDKYTEIDSLVEGREIRQTFELDGRGMSAISILFRGGKEENQGTLHIELTNETTGEVVKRWNKPESKLRDNKLAVFKLKEEILDNNDIYSISITSLDNKEGDSLSLCMTEEDLYQNGTCEVDGVLQDGDILFSVNPPEVDYSFLKPVFWFVCGLMMLVMTCIWYFIFIKKTYKTEWVFVLFMLGFGFVYLLVLPAFYVPDEPVHFSESYRISNEFFGVEDENLPYVMVRECDAVTELGLHPTLWSYGYIHENLFAHNNHTEEMQLFLIGKSTNGPLITHLPQAIGITIARLLHLSFPALLYMGQFAVLLFYTVCMFFAIRITPVGKHLFFVVSTLPMMLHEASSFGCDPIICGLIFLFTAYMLRLIYAQDRICWKDYVFTIVLTWIFAPCKMVYSIITALVFLISKEKFKKPLHRYLYQIGLPLLAIVRGVSYNMSVVAGTTGGEKIIGWANEEGYTISYLLHNPGVLFWICVNTIHERFDFYWKTMIGGSLGWFEINLPYVLVAGFTVLLVIALREHTELRIPFRHKVLMVLIIIGVVGMVEASMLLAWTPISYDWIEGVQGRYFLPVLPLLLLCFMETTKEQDIKNRKILFLGTCFLNHLIVLRVIEYIVSL